LAALAVSQALAPSQLIRSAKLLRAFRTIDSRSARRRDSAAEAEPAGGLHVPTPGTRGDAASLRLITSMSIIFSGEIRLIGAPSCDAISSVWQYVSTI